MTTTVTTPLRGSSPHRIRRSVIAALVGGALFASTAFAVNRILDNDSPPTAVNAPNAPSVASEAGIPGGATAADVCGGELGWVCAVAGLSSGATATDVCGGEFGWVCAVAGLSGGATATDVCAGEFGWACIVTKQS